MWLFRSRINKILIIFSTISIILYILHLQKGEVQETISVINLSLTLNDISPNYSFKPIFYSKSQTSILLAPKIPQLFHQIWDSNQIPKYFASWLTKWKKTHPHWKHIFWNFDEVKKLIKLHYPDYLTLYESYLSPIFRADVARYFILHHFGGVYVDIDMVPLRLFDNWTMHYNCLVSEEPYEHVYIVRELTKQKPNYLNGFIACKRGHGVLKLVIEMLAESAKHHFGDYLHATGPYFFTRAINKYLESQIKPDLTIVPPEYFFSTFDKSESDIISGKCYPNRIKSLPPEGQLICRGLLQSSFKNEPSLTAYSDHYWVHSYLFADNFKTEDTLSIGNISSHIQPGLSTLIL